MSQPESDESTETAEWSVWQSEERRCGVVLREVFAWLEARQLARAGGVCAAWRRAARDPPLWRRLLLRDGLLAPHTLRQLHALRRDPDTVSWRQEYVSALAGWKLEARYAAAGGAALLHAALAPRHDALALAADDASLAVWCYLEGSWRELWRTDLRARGWAGVARVQWANAAPRLLLAGPRALIDDWELMVLHLDVASRVRCSAGAAGCWADPAGDAFLSLELRRLGPGLACTTVWLNAATQETQSEYAGVTSPLLRIFNENRAHITHTVVMDVPSGGDDVRRVLVAGSARGLATWPVVEPRPLPLLAGEPGELAERVRRRRARRAEPEDEAPEPDEDSVRAGCTPPDREYLLAAPLVGLVAHDRERRLWASCADGSVTCVCARSLAPLCVLGARGPPGPPAAPASPLHYVQPDVSERFLASPAGAFSSHVWTWSLRSGAAAQCGGGGGGGGGEGRGDERHAGPAVCALLPRTAPGTMLVLAAHYLYVWRSRATPQSQAERFASP
ncbi:uncharacterized protein LOC142987124 isoform X2 [Anticarsia gemmatalis]|uniref:uncharacterized protein LOC142987124 isoform X2 n=1 Tax=Anticarsia gemmatalis TaxID=129554 RepID=UPI003F774D70